jgi:hypothetical protein
VEDRLKALQTGCPHRLSVAGTIEMPSEKDARQTETGLHTRFGQWKLTGEWFALPDWVIQDLIAHHGVVPVPPADEFKTLRFEFYKGHYIWIERNSMEGGCVLIVEDRASGEITTQSGYTIQEVLSEAKKWIDEGQVS